SANEAERRKALDELSGFVKNDMKATLEAMDGLAVTFRLLDPPLHEFVPQSAEKQAELAKALGIEPADVAKRGESLHESNPMMGHRGVRLGITYPEITEMQVRAMFEATAELLKEKKNPKPELMVPVTCDVSELDVTRKVVDRVYAEVLKKTGLDKIEFKYGTMIEIPRATLLADRMAKSAEFFSFGTNDLTQMTFGYSRDDSGAFLPEYINQNILPQDPTASLDQEGVGQLVDWAAKLGRGVKKELKLGICGEHGGNPSSIAFCHAAGLNYVSCSPFRVPVARISAAHAAMGKIS
ncbi:MAG TPA: pyruvate, phosphate dikinase, partial [Aminivibrio sp.]|nr:pyruvate, phosphate dikinase [Aminivibrio sp.]